jgi:hypothetical protein
VIFGEELYELLKVMSIEIFYPLNSLAYITNDPLRTEFRNQNHRNRPCAGTPVKLEELMSQACPESGPLIHLPYALEEIVLS